MKGPQRLCLVTDANRALDMPPGEYRFGSADDRTTFTSDGRVGWASGGSLASSVVGMDRMVQTMRQQTTASLPDIVRMASLTPAERTGIADRTGSLEPGKSADVLLLNSQLEVERVFVRGQEVACGQRLPHGS
jgi:N-acetylglucosamine-6-phosphate deacetylase